MNRLLILSLSIFALISCSQEQIILVKDLPSVNILTLEDILNEAGFPAPEPKSAATNIAVKLTTNQYVSTTKTKKAETTNYYRVIPSGEEFSISIYYPDSFVVLDEIPDAVDYLEDDSYPDSGFFMFKNGTSDSIIVFKVYDLGGNPEKIINYNISTVVSETDTDTDEVDLDSMITDDETLEVPDSFSIDLTDVIIDSLKGLSTSEKINTLESNIISAGLSDDEQDLLYREWIDILMDNRRFTEADTQIANINDESLQDLYYGKYYQLRKKYPQAQLSYIQALDGDPEVEKEAVLLLEEMLFDYGNVEESVIDDLYSRTAEYESSDSDFYVESLLNIGRLYEYVMDIYTAEDIYQSVIDGDYSRKTRKKAEEYLEELKDNFLYYK